MKQIVLMDKSRIQRSLKRMAIQVWETLDEGEEIILVGLNDRGFAIATALQMHLQSILAENSVELFQFDVKNLTHNKPLPECSEKTVIIIDDVIFSGKTIFDALKAVDSAGEPKKIQTLALLDRGHRTYPIESNITGMSIPTKLGEHIEVLLSNNQPEQVVLFKNT